MLSPGDMPSWRCENAAGDPVLPDPRNLNTRWSRLALGLFTALACGCVTAPLQRNLAASAKTQRGEFSTMLERVRSEPRAPLAWEGAYRRLQQDNIPLRQSRQQLAESEKQTRRQWWSLVPKVAAFLSIGTNISSLTNLSSDDLNARLIANFNIPNPFEFYAGLYAAALQKQNARWSHELDRRRAYAQLYAAFVDARALDEAVAALQRQRQALASSDMAVIGKTLKNLASETYSMERRQLYHRSNVNQLLNTPGGNWNLTGTLPVVSYSSRYRQMKIGEDFGKLALNLYAIQIEGALLQLQQVKFQQWPSINFGFSNPPLFSNQDNASFSSDDLTLFSGASKSMDLSDIGGRQLIRDAETRLKFTREQLRQRLEYEASKVLQMASSYDQLLKEASRLRRDLARMARPASSEPDLVIKDLELRAQLDLQLIENRRQIQQLDLQLLIWDERFWKS